MDKLDLIEKECAAARTRCVLIERLSEAPIEVLGEDRVTFLHHVLTNDIQKLAAGEGAYACLLNDQAKVLADMVVLMDRDRLILLVQPDLREKVTALLEQKIIMDRVELVDRSRDLVFISLHGPNAGQVLSAAISNQDLPKNLWSHRPAAIAGTPVTLIRVNKIGETGFGILFAREQIIPVRIRIMKEGEPFGLDTLEANTIEILRIEAGIPRYGVDFDEHHLLPEVGLEQAVSYTKGCFPGQEVLARLDSRGHVNRKLTGLDIRGAQAPQKGDHIVKGDQEAGSITSAAYSPTLKKVLALGYLKLDLRKGGTEVTVESSGERLPARVRAFPFY